MSKSKRQKLKLKLPPDTHPALIRILKNCCKLMAPPPEMTVSQWADEHRILSREDSAEPGRWSTARMEPMRAIMDAFNDSSCEEIVLMKGTQIGFTAVLGNILGYIIDLDPGPVLLMQPTKAMAEEYSKARLAPMLRDTPRLKGKVKEAATRDSGNTILNKEFIGGRCAIIGANAPAEIASRPIKIVLCDEVDRYPLSAGTEGDPMKLAEKRQETFWNRKRFKGSSPTVKGQSRIERDYAASDQRKFFVPCHACGSLQTLRWENVKWDRLTEKEGRAHQPHTAHYQCESCGELWTDAQRWDAISKGHWEATAPFRGVAGFHLSQLYSSWVKLEKMVTEFLTAYGKLPGTHPDVNLMQVFTNTCLAETWEEKGETVNDVSLMARAEAYGPDDLPDVVRFATAGVDTQGDRLECQIIAWGPNEESWVARYEVIQGDPAQKAVWEELDKIIAEPLSTASGRLVRVKATCVDAGGHHAAQVHAYCKSKPGQRIFPVVGMAGPKLIWPKRLSRGKHGSVYGIGVDTGKDAVYGRLKIPQRELAETASNPGFVHFPICDEQLGTGGIDSAYFAQLTSEKVMTRYKMGKPYRVWELPPGKRNEALDTFVYALAARMAVPINLRTNRAIADVDAEVVKTTPEVSKELPAPVETVMPAVKQVQSRGDRFAMLGRMTRGR
jgi:phage terminase large subunit GpA-like protein